MSELDLRLALADLADQAESRDLAAGSWRTARRRRQRRASAGAAAAVVVVAGLAFGFGARAGGRAPAPVPPVASGPHSTAPTPRPPASPSSPPASPAPTVVQAGRTTFASPSGDITCAMDTRAVTCDEAQASWSLTPADLASCGQAALAGLTLPAVGKPGFDCRTDVLVPDPRQVLAYGASITVGDITCASASTGVTCRNQQTGHEFFVSRQTYRMS